jgi:hypothetical protein
MIKEREFDNAREGRMTTSILLGLKENGIQ